MWHAFCFYMYMMKMQITIKYGWRLACLLLFGSVVGAGAQESWSVDSCMRYALERNLALKNSRLDTRIAREDFTAAIGDFLPSVSTSGAFGKRMGRSVDPENEFVYHLFLRGKYAGSRYIIACFRRVQTYQPGTVHPAEQATEQRCRKSGGEPGGFRGDGCLLCIYL